MKDINNLSLANLTGDIILPDHIPQIVNKWIMTALVLHVAASVAALISIIALSFSTPRPLFGIIVAEFFTAITGLGGIIVLYANNFATAKLFVPIIVTGVLGIVLSSVVALIERRLSRWRISERQRF